MATYRPSVGGSGTAARGSSGHDLAAAARGGGDGAQRGEMAPKASVMVFLVDLRVRQTSEGSSVRLC